MSSVNTSKLGEVLRIYKNSAGEILAAECVSINVNRLQINEFPHLQKGSQFITTVDKVNVAKTIFNLGSVNRVIASVQSIGNYDVLDVSDLNYLVVTWSKKNNEGNDISLSLAPYVFKISDVI